VRDQRREVAEAFATAAGRTGGAIKVLVTP
jgi:hypothetical protein